MTIGHVGKQRAQLAMFTDHTAYFRFRDELLGPSRTRLLTGAELCEAGRLIYGHPEDFSLYGIPAPGMEAQGLRLLGRTTIECCIDAYSAAVADAVAELQTGMPPAEEAMIVDLFCGSGNIGYHLGQRLGHPVFASELDSAVYRATHHNLSLIGSAIELRWVSYRDLLHTLAPCGPRDTYVVEPSWGPAFTTEGLDLEATSPPMSEILADIRCTRGGQSCLIVIKTNDQIAHNSLATTFQGATHLSSVTPTPTLPYGANTDFHIYQLADS